MRTTPGPLPEPLELEKESENCTTLITNLIALGLDEAAAEGGKRQREQQGRRAHRGGEVVDGKRGPLVAAAAKGVDKSEKHGRTGREVPKSCGERTQLPLSTRQT